MSDLDNTVGRHLVHIYVNGKGRVTATAHIDTPSQPRESHTLPTAAKSLSNHSDWREQQSCLPRPSDRRTFKIPVKFK